KYLVITLTAIAGLLFSSGCATTVGTGAAANTVQFDPAKAALFVEVGTEAGTAIAVRRDPAIRPYLEASVIVINTAISNGQYDPTQLRATLLGLKVNELHSEDAILGVDVALKLYQAAFGDAVSSKLDQTTALKPILTALAQG